MKKNDTIERTLCIGGIAMQFRKQDSEDKIDGNHLDKNSRDAYFRIAKDICDAHRFANRLMPSKHNDFDETFNKLQVIVCRKDSDYKVDGKFYDYRVFEDGKFYDHQITGVQGQSVTCINHRDDQIEAIETIAVFDRVPRQAVIHETLHALSTEVGKTEKDGLYIKKGAYYKEYDSKEHEIINKGNLLNETITDALASRAIGDIGPGRKGGYGYNVMMADLLIGEKIENNSLIQDVYFGNGNIFAEDFNKTLINSQVKFSDYEQDFYVESDKSYELLKGAVEYNLRKASSSEEIDKVYAFQQKIINFYKSRGESIEGEKILDLVEDDTICMMDNLLKFADKMQKQCKSNLVAQKMITKQRIKGA